MTTDTKVLTILRDAMTKAQNELAQDVADFIDWCLERDIVMPSEEDVQEWLKTKEDV